MPKIDFKLLALLVLVACSSATPDKTQLRDKLSEKLRKQQAEIIYRRIQNDPRTGELISAYFDFYAYSLRKKCNGGNYETNSPEIESLRLPRINFGSVLNSSVSDENDIAADFFDLTDVQENQKYNYFFLSREIRQWEFAEGWVNPAGPQTKLVLLRTKQQNQIRYVICSEKLGANYVCSNDSLITKLADVNDSSSLCDAITIRKIPMGREQFLRSIIDLIVQLELIRGHHFVRI